MHRSKALKGQLLRLIDFKFCCLLNKALTPQTQGPYLERQFEIDLIKPKL